MPCAERTLREQMMKAWTAVATTVVFLPSPVGDAARTGSPLRRDGTGNRRVDSPQRAASAIGTKPTCVG